MYEYVECGRSFLFSDLLTVANKGEKSIVLHYNLRVNHSSVHYY